MKQAKKHIQKGKIIMEYLKIENNKGLFYREGEGMKEVSKMTKDDLYDLVHAAIHEEDFSMDAYDEELLKNPAHQTIYSHVTLPMLIGIERSRVDVDVRVKLLDSDVVASGLQQFAYRRGDYTLAQR